VDLLLSSINSVLNVSDEKLAGHVSAVVGSFANC